MVHPVFKRKAEPIRLPVARPEAQAQLSPVVLVSRKPQKVTRTTSSWLEMKAWLSAPLEDKTDICQAICGVCSVGLSTNGLQWNEETPEIGKILLCGHMLCESCCTNKTQDASVTSIPPDDDDGKSEITMTTLSSSQTVMSSNTPTERPILRHVYICPVCTKRMDCRKCNKPCVLATLPRPLEKARHNVKLEWTDDQLHRDEKQTAWEVPYTLPEGQFDERKCSSCNGDRLQANGREGVYEAQMKIGADRMLTEQKRKALLEKAREQKRGDLL